MDLSQETVRSLLDYDPKTGMLTWKPRERGLFKNDLSHVMWNKRFPGKRAGSFSQRSKAAYRPREIGIFGKLYREHRVVWLWMNGHPVPKAIDHINRNPLDNRWSNLREADYSSNSRNRNKQTNNTSGVTGVYWSKARKKWTASCRVDGILIHLGGFDSKEDAEHTVIKFRDENGFSKDHGRLLGMHAIKYIN